MKADLTRKSFDPAKAFSRVVMQQGRVQLDADWNEQAAITLHALRRLAMDLGGQAWTPDGGFLPRVIGGVAGDVALSPGGFYVDGILCETASSPVPLALQPSNPGVLGVAQWTVDDQPFAVGQYLLLSDGPPTDGSAITQVVAIDYAHQTVTVADAGSLAGAASPQALRVPTYLTQPSLAGPPALFSGKTGAQLYLDVWERLVTFAEDDSIREVALNGADTAARTKVIWQVRALPLPPATRSRAGTNTDPVAPAPIRQPLNRGLLRARVEPAAPSTDPCAISPLSSYRGPENQLYRVEIHDGGVLSAAPTFKWSRENGSVVFPVSAPAAAGDGTLTVTLATLGRDDRFGLALGGWVELQDDTLATGNAALTGAVPPLLQVRSIGAGARQVTLAGAAPSAGFGGTPSLHPLLRRWDQQAGDPTQGGVGLTAGGAIPIAGGSWIDLEDGVQVRFEATDTATYRSGDFWLIPARVATGDIIWPTELDANQQPQRVARAPDGVDHHYATLATVTPGTGSSPVPNISAAVVKRQP